MMEFDAFRGITRRALSINYVCPAICELVSEASGSGSGTGISATLGIDATARRLGPELLLVEVVGGTVTLQWSPRDYAFSYNVYLSSTSEEGPFVLQTANLLETHFVLNLTPGTFYAKVTLVESDFGESFPSPTVQIVVV